MLICAIVAGLVGGFTARYRSWGTGLADIATGVLAATLISTVALVVLAIWADLNQFGLIHYVYLLAVVGFPIGVAIIVTPHLLNAEFKTPLIVWPLVILALGAVASGLWGTHVEPNRLELDEVVLGAEGAAQPLLIGVIADLQTPNIGDHEVAAREVVTNGDPQVVVVPGDLYQIPPDELDAQLPEFLGWLRELVRTVEHVVIVNGDVDDPTVLEELAEESGANYLADELLTLDIDGQDVVFAGMSITETRDSGEVNEELIQALADTTTEADLVIAVSHTPDNVLSYDSASPIDLTIAGHTHGGQVSLCLLYTSDAADE